MHWSEKFLIDQLGLSHDWAALVSTFLLAIIIPTLGMLLVIFTIWLERKIAARFRVRVGPNRVGSYGLLQSFADMFKLIIKEQIVPRNADKVVYFIAPILAVMAVIGLFAVIPLNKVEIGADLSVGALYFVAIGSLGTIAILLAGWGSNNKYALLGAFRVIAQMISYEIPMVMALLVPVLLAGTMSMQGIVQARSSLWYVFYVPVAATIFFIASIAEVGRQPFDLLEADSEIVAGYNIEYSGMQFGLFMLAEFLHGFVICILAAVLFLGGWHGPFASDIPILGIVYLGLKTFLVYGIELWIRLTTPRFRIDHMMSFNWMFLVPLSIFNLLIVAFIWKAMPEPTETGLMAELPRAFAVLVGNIALVAITFALLRNTGQEREQRVEALVDETVYPAAISVKSTAGTD